MHTNKIKSSDARHAYFSLLIITVICHLLFDHYSKSQVLSQHRTKRSELLTTARADHWSTSPLSRWSQETTTPTPTPYKKKTKTKQKTKEQDIHGHQIVSLQVHHYPLSQPFVFFLFFKNVLPFMIDRTAVIFPDYLATEV